MITNVLPPFWYWCYSDRRGAYGLTLSFLWPPVLITVSGALNSWASQFTEDTETLCACPRISSHIGCSLVQSSGKPLTDLNLNPSRRERSAVSLADTAVWPNSGLSHWATETGDHKCVCRLWNKDYLLTVLSYFSEYGIYTRRSVLHWKRRSYILNPANQIQLKLAPE